jgi:hypothetical protein
MAESNGHSPDGMALPSEYQDFMIGGKAIRVRELRLSDLDLAREPILALDGGLWWADYAMKVCQIISIIHPEYGTGKELMDQCSIPEARGLAESWGNLLTKSGFNPVGEAEAATATESPGTGTSTQSSQSLEQEGSVAEIPGLSSEPSP